MADATGFTLIIDDKMLNKLDQADKKIEQLQKTADKTSVNVVSAFKQMAMGIDPFLSKLNEANSVLSKMAMPKVSSGGFSNLATEAEKAATATANITVALNKGLSIQEKERKVFVEKYSMYQRMFDSIEKQTKAQERLAQAEERRNKRAQEKIQNRDNNAAIKAEEQYQRALNKTEVTIANRARKIEALSNAERALVKTGRDYTTEINKIRTETERLNKANEDAAKSTAKIKATQSSLMDTSGQLKRQFALLFSVSQIEGYVNKLVTIRGEFELQQRSLQAILQNKDEADKLFGQITDLAVRSPFRVKELVTYTKELAAYRIESEKLYDTTKMLADISAGLGVDMSRLILAYGQVKAANYLRGTELRQFSEAGINILGELATYFTELEGQMVSVGDVFERVSKRMVSFGDVEEVFKRITSAGGIFYNMQEIQAETLQGQISNLYDSIDIMFNEIGKANDGTLKNTVALLRSMVENWEILANILKATGVGFALYAAKVIIATAANKGFTASQIEATIASGGLSKGLAKAALGFNALGNFVKTNPFILIASSVSALVFGLIDHNNKVDQARAKYDILTDSLSRQKGEISDIVSKMKEQDKIIKSSSDIMSEFSKGTSEYTKAQSDNNEASKQRNLLLEELRTKHPQIYNGLVQQKDGTIDLTKAQEEYNKQLEQTNYLNFLASQTETFWSDGLVSNLSELSENQNKAVQQTNQLDAAWKQLTGRLEVYLANNKYIGADTKKQFDEIANSSASNAEKIQKLYSLARNTHTVNIGDLRSMLYEYVDEARNFTDANNALGKSQEVISSQIKTIAQDAKLAFNLSTEEGRKRAAETLRIFIESLGVQEQAVKDFITQRFEVEIGVKVATAPIVSQYIGMQKVIKEYVEKNKLSIDVIKPDQSASDYFSKLNADLKDSESYVKKLEKATEQLDIKMSNEDAIKAEKKKQEEYKKTLAAFGELSSKADTKAAKDALTLLNERISLIKEINSEYEKLLKNYSKEEAAAKVRASYAETWKDLFKGTSMEKSIMSIDFNTQGAIKSLEDLGKNAAPKLRRQILKAVDGLKAQVDLDIRVQRTEEIRSDIEKLFSGYELSLELEKINIPPDLAKQLFNVDVFNLDELQKRAKPYLDELKSKGDDQIKIAEDIEKEISDMQYNEQLNRMKKYSQYLANSTTERVKLKIKELNEIAEIKKTFNKPEQEEERKIVIKKVQEESKKELQKQEWADFKGTDMYTMMFEDIEYMGTKAISKLKENLKQLKGSLSDLPVEQVKEIMTQISKLEEQEIKRNPFDSLRKSMEGVKKLQKKGRTEEYLQNELAMSEAQIASSKEQIDAIDTIITARKKNLSLESQSSDWIAKNTVLLKMSNGELNTQRGILSENVEKNKNISSRAQTDLTQYSKARKSLDAMAEEWSQIRSLALSAYDSIKKTLVSMGVESDSTALILVDMGMSLIDLVAQAILFDLQMKLLTIQAELLGVAINSMLGPIGWIVIALQAVATLFTSIFAVGDKKKEKEIEKEKEKVEKLERAYKKLDKAIKSAYDLDLLKTSTEAASKNIDAQIASYEKMIQAEDAKKKTDKDKIKDWQNTILDLQEQKKQLQIDMVKAVGGFGDAEAMKEAAQDFADAWYDAYKETGDGLTGLTDKFDEFIDNVIKKQIMLRGVGKMLEPLFQMVDKMFDKTSEGAESVTKNELDKLKEYSDTLLPQLDKFMKDMMASLGITGGKTELSGLQKGIQGVTEETASALESLLNSMRFFVADSNLQLKNIYNILTNVDAPNPILNELKAQTSLVRSIYDLFNGMTAPHPTLGKRGLLTVI